MSFDEWLLALHVLSAFAYVAALVLFSVLIVAVRARRHAGRRRSAWSRVAKIGNAGVAIGAGGTIVLGIWLAFSYGGYDIWDPWIIAAIVLWAVAGGLGQRTGAAYMAGHDKAKELDAARPDRARTPSCSRSTARQRRRPVPRRSRAWSCS